MAESSNIEVKNYLKWSIVLPVCSLLSPAFKVQGFECRLQITKLVKNWTNLAPADCYSIKVHQKPGKLQSLQFLILRAATDQCNETTSPFSLDSYTRVDWDILEQSHIFRGQHNTRVTFIVHFHSDVKFSSEISEADNKIDQTASQLTQMPCLKALSQDFSRLLEQESEHDVILRCRDHIVKAHKIVLVSRSKVFEGMLHSGMLEGQTDEVEIKDMDVEVFQDLVRYVYAGTVPELDEDKAKKLYEAGDQYAVESLMQRCSTFLSENLTKENACDILDLAEAHSDSDFKERVIGYILKKKVPLIDEFWKPFSVRCPHVAVDVLNRFIKMKITT